MRNRMINPGLAWMAALLLSALRGQTVLAAELFETAQERTLRFPGGTYSQIAATNGLAVASSDWSREDGIGVFDVSDPAQVRFLARFPAKGYCCYPPVFFGSRCYVPSGFTATVINLADPKHPRFEGYLNPHFPGHGCEELRVVDGALCFRAGKQIFRLGADGFSFEPVSMDWPKGRNSRSAVTDGITVSIADGAIRTDRGGECPYACWLSSVAVKDGAAYVYSPLPGNRSGIRRLDLGGAGVISLSTALVAAELPRGVGYMTMGMQTASAIERRGELLFADDGIYRFAADGSLGAIRERTGAASAHSFDGSRVAIAQGSRCRVLGFADPAAASVLEVVPAGEGPLHLTGCVLEGDSLFVAYTRKETPKMDFIYRKPSRGYVAYIDLAKGTNAVSTLELPAAIAMAKAGRYLYVTCRGGKVAVIDAGEPAALRLVALRENLQHGESCRIKRFGDGLWLLDGTRIVRLDLSDPEVPRVAHAYAREPLEERTSYDDFTVEGGVLYALAHGSLDVFRLDDPPRTKKIAEAEPNFIPPAAETNLTVFAGHRVASAPAGVRFRAGRFGHSFGAFVFDCCLLPDDFADAAGVARGGYAVAYGEAGLVLCDAKGDFAAELPGGRDGAAFFAAAVLIRDGILYVLDDASAVRRLTPTDFRLLKSHNP